MKLGEFYKHNKKGNIIQIDSFGTRMNSGEDFIVIFRNIFKMNDIQYGSTPSGNGYGTQEEIEKEYNLVVKQEELKNFNDYNEVVEYIKVNNV